MTTTEFTGSPPVSVRTSRHDDNGQRVIVVGAGLSGLVAAYELQKLGHPVTLLESSSFCGGRARSEHIQAGDHAIVVNNGAYLLSTGFRVVTQLIEELGLSEDVRRLSPYFGLVHEGKVRRVNLENLNWPLQLGVWNHSDWHRYAASALGSLGQALRDCHIDEPAPWVRFDDALGTWCSSHWGERVGSIVNAAVEAIYFQSPSQVSRILALMLLAQQLRGEYPCSLKSGYGLLIDSLASRLSDLRFNARVTAIDVGSDGVAVSVGDEILRATDVVLATPAHVARKIYLPATSSEQALLDVEYAGTINIILDVACDWHQHHTFRGAFGVSIPPNERKPDDVICAISIESGRTRQAEAGHETLAIMLHSDGAEKMLKVPQQELLDRVLREASAYMPGLADAKVNFSRVRRFPHALPRSDVGRLKMIERYKRELSPASRVKIVGDYVGGFPTTGSAASSGRWGAIATARAIEERQGQRLAP